MDHDKYDKDEDRQADYKPPSNGNEETSGRQQKEEKEDKAVKDILLAARKVRFWENGPDTRPLKIKITANTLFGSHGDTFLLHLIMTQNPTLKETELSLWTDEPKKPSVGPKASNDFRGIGKQLLRWMLKDKDLSKFFTNAPSQVVGVRRLLEKKPIHLAIEVHNWSFLACFLGICHDPDLADQRLRTNAILEEKDENSEDRNCIHHAIDWEIPFAPFMVAICSAKALKEKDRKGYTPMHIALRKPTKAVESIPECPRSAANAGAPSWDDKFSPPRILDELKKRKDVLQEYGRRKNDRQENKRKDDREEKLIETILITTNKDGKSPFQEILEQCKPENKPTAETFEFLGQFKQLIFDNVEKISDVSTALYGTKGDVKELCLDMSDFNQSSHNFETFVDKLTQLDANPDEKETAFEFEDPLFFVHLPDLNYVKQPCSHHATRRLFEWLSDKKKVRKIKKLSIPDNTINPLSEAFVEQYILDAFDIEELDWRKLDVNLDVITGTKERRRPAKEGKKPPSDTWKSLKHLTLYSSGNWSALYHWISEDGLARLPALSTVRINIVHLNPAEGFYDEATNERHLSLATEYKGRLEREHSSKMKIYKGRNDVPFQFKYKPDIKVDALWDYPPPPHEPDEPTTRILKHQFTSQLLPSLNALREWDKQKINLDESDDYDEEWEEVGAEINPEKALKKQIARFQRFALDPQRTPSRLDRIDQRIRVAIIDNGADRIRSKFRQMIAKGQSYVTADLLGSDRSLPWWMVSDPHGTQMASLIGQTNNYCRLYIARVGKGRNDIDPVKAAKAIDWAVDQKVDIISISWTLNQENSVLEKAIKNAVDHSTLIFCSTPDQGVYSDAWPAMYKKYVLSVSATDNLGHLTSKTKGTDAVDIQIPGENVRAAGPAYIGNMNETVSGSSVATALAAGVASLALLMLRTFNPELGVAGRCDGDREAMQDFYTRDGIMRVFRGMGADKSSIKLSKLFPDETVDEFKILEILARNWKVENFPKPPPKQDQEL
ncbi:hypothetical protein N431DRAFT_362973 [Stipitochalara longipes BDJ]|nr:hypothetical protein N431DRAFT_362973 [Stipitochalara longipes BDJ]